MVFFVRGRFAGYEVGGNPAGDLRRDFRTAAHCARPIVWKKWVKMATSARHAHDVAPRRDRLNQAVPTSTLLPAGFLALLQPLWRPLTDYHTTSDLKLQPEANMRL